MRVLSNGQYTVFVGSTGSGGARWDRWAVTGGAGVVVHVHDGDDTRSIGATPLDRAPDVSRPGVATATCGDAALAVRVDVAVAADADVEVRRIRIRNGSSSTRRVQLTTYAEVVLNDPNAHAAHPAFSKLFVETERAADVLLARRRPRSAGERVAWAFHALVGDGSLEVETDRARFLGRGRTPATPAALAAPLSGSVGSVLDPIFALRRTVDVAAGGETELVVLVGAAATREAALALATRAWRADDVLAGAERRERDVLARSGVADADVVGALTAALVDGHRALAPDAGTLQRARGADPATLDRLGLSPWVPYVVADAGAPLDVLVAAYRYWRAQGLAVRMLVVGDDPPAVAEDGLVVRRRAELTARELDVARALAAVVVDGPVVDGPLLELAAAAAGPTPSRYAPLAGTAPRAPTGDGLVGLVLANGFGGFAPGGDEYVIRLGDRPPMPWVNVLANETFGCLVSEAGSAFTWSRNSHEHRLTPWSNDPVVDPYGEALWVRDDDAGVFWSPLPGPTPPPSAFEVRHGFGRSTWRHASADLEQDVTIAVPRRDPVRIVRLRLTNRAARARRLSIFAYAELVLGVLPSRTVVTAFDTDASALVAENPLAGDFADGVAFAAAIGADTVGYTADRRAFLGRDGSLASPDGVRGDRPLDGAVGAGLDPCAALHVTLAVAPGATAECAFLLGEVTDRAAVREIVGRWRSPGAVDRALDEVRAFWDDVRAAVHVETPSPALDLMVNGWLLHQDLSCRLWGRSAFYQSGGAFGFRDQLQDAAALVSVRPDLTRAQILLHAAHQFIEGDVLHWWHPPASRGIRTRFSDDFLWLPYVTAFYVGATGDRTVLDERVGFLRARPLAPGEDEAYLLPERAEETADVYAHCCRALDRSLATGAHGLPLMGTGDWNDGMNRVGREGRGESVWLAFFLHHVLGRFAPLCDARGDGERAARYRAHRVALERAVETSAWDGAWYRRAYYDDGTPLGSAASDECRIDAIAQAWAVISGAAPRERAERAMDAVERELVVERDGIIRLLWPPFDRTPHDPGYIKGYVPGIRENGGQYTHGVLWVVRALAELGHRDRAVHLLEMLTPVHQARSAEAVAIYQVEPYVVAADVYGVAPHVGRGGWTWYTGSAGWMYRIALESILGVTLEDGATLVVRPRVPDAWPGFTIRLRLPDAGTRYDVEVVNPTGRAERVTEATVDGTAVPVADGAARISLARDGAAHRVRVVLG